MLLQQMIRWSVEGQSLVLFLEAIPRAGGDSLSQQWVTLSEAPTISILFPSQAPHLSARLLQVSRVMSGAVGQT